MTKAAAHKTVIRRNDLIQVLIGRDGGRLTRKPADAAHAREPGRRGRVLRVDRDSGRALIEGVNTVMKARRPDPRRGHRGGIVEQNAPVPLANLMLVCRKCDRPVRVRIVREKRKLTRLCRKCGAEV